MSCKFEIPEGTTRKMRIKCLDQDKNNFNFSGYQLQTWYHFFAQNSTVSDAEGYLETTATDNVVSFTFPAPLTVGMDHGGFETRIFKDGEVYRVIKGLITINKSDKPDVTYQMD